MVVAFGVQFCNKKRYNKSTHYPAEPVQKSVGVSEHLFNERKDEDDKNARCKTYKEVKVSLEVCSGIFPYGDYTD